MTRHLLAVTGIAALSIVSASAALVDWQSAVAAGTTPAATNFTTIIEPTLFDIGTLTGDRSLEFIVRADISAFGASAALIGTFDAANGRQALKAKQWNGAENPDATIGLTAFGVADHFSTSAFPSNADTHLIFSSNGTDTLLYLNGELVHTFTGVALALTGIQGLGGAPNGDVWVDPLTGGSIFGFASYDSALSADEIGAHYAAFAAPVPEPGSLGLAAVAGLAFLSRRARRSA